MQGSTFKDHLMNPFANPVVCFATPIAPTLAINILQHYLQTNNLLQLVFLGTIPSATIFAVLDFIKQHQITCLPRIVTTGVIDYCDLARFIEEHCYVQIYYNKSHEVAITKLANILRLHNFPAALKVKIDAINVNQMRNLVNFAKENYIDTISFARGDSNLAELYISNYFKALERALQLEVNFYSPEIYQHLLKKPPPPIAVWLPNGNLVLTDFNSQHVIGNYEDGFTCYKNNIALLWEKDPNDTTSKAILQHLTHYNLSSNYLC